MKNEMINMIEARKEKMRRDYAENWITREEYIVLKAELMAILIEINNM